MDVFQDLVVKGSGGKLLDFVRFLQPPSHSGWSRCEELENRLARERPSEGESYCFLTAQQDNRPAAHLWLTYRHNRPDEMYVPNVVPCDDGTCLSHEQYNSIVTDFCRLIAEPAATKAGVTVTLSKAQFHVEDFLSPNAAKLVVRQNSAGA